jgi:hypothetical protein
VADDDGVLLTQRADQCGDVGGGGRQVVAARGLVTAAVAAQVRRDGAEAGRGQRRQLRPPGPPELGEAVQEQDERIVGRATLRDVEPGPVGRDQ